MVTSSSPLAFSDCYDTLTKALASTHGLRLRFANEGDARHFRTRLHAARVLHREGNAEVYDSTHPMHGNSEYDALVVKLRKGTLNGEWLLLIEKVEKALQVEEIEGEYEIIEPLPSPEPIKLIEDQTSKPAPGNKIERRI